MGYKQSLTCPICNYETFTSGGPDRGFRTWTNTYVCSDCKTINDLVIEKGEFGLTRDGVRKPDRIKDDQKCDECGGTHFELWDSKKKPCPKCGTGLKPDPNGMTMNWD